MIEVLKQALDVLKSKDTWGSSIREAKEDVIKALEEALAKQEHGEPVAWYCKEGLKCGVSLKQESPEWTPLYTTPQRTWAGLTDDDEIPWDGVDAKSFAKAIEAKLKEKNT